MQNALIFGLIGVALLLASWAYETYEQFKVGRGLDLRFALPNLIAIGFLTYYSWAIGNALFFWLNLILEIFVITEIVVGVIHRRK